MAFIKNIIRPRRTTHVTEASHGSSPQDDLGMQHLRKIYRDYSSLLDETERESTLKKLCPLFVRVFTLNTPNIILQSTIQDKLGDVSGFAKHVALYLTQQVSFLFYS